MASKHIKTNLDWSVQMHMFSLVIVPVKLSERKEGFHYISFEAVSVLIFP